MSTEKAELFNGVKVHVVDVKVFDARELPKLENIFERYGDIVSKITNYEWQRDKSRRSIDDTVYVLILPKNKLKPLKICLTETFNHNKSLEISFRRDF